MYPQSKHHSENGVIAHTHPCPVMLHRSCTLRVPVHPRWVLHCQCLVQLGHSADP